MKKRIAILGSTGSVGKQALEVIERFPEKFEVEVLTANKNAELLIKQALKFNPNAVVIGDEKFFDKVSNALYDNSIKVYAGYEAIAQITAMETIDMVLMAIIGFQGLKPTLTALKNKKPIALANKESLVIAGNIVKKTALDNKTPIIPVDSEHSAIFQCLVGEGNNKIKKVILTASGGPFRNHKPDELKNISPSTALNHPTWNMGDKISIDSATMINKGFEAMEAQWLFNLQPNQIEIVIHPQSVVHAFVYFTDGNVKSIISNPDMRIPILYALSFPERLKLDTEDFNPVKTGSLTFESPDIKIFRNLALALKAMKKGGNVPCLLNAANEVAVESFLNNNLSFSEIPEVTEYVINSLPFIMYPKLEDIINCDKAARQAALKFIENKHK